jgi:hypothetical protein
MAKYFLPFLVGCFCCAGIGYAETSYPMLMSISPVAVQVGTSTECEITARYNLDGAYRIFVTGVGVSGEVIAATTEKQKNQRRPVGKLKVRFRVDAHALPGAREVRVATPQGVSTVGQLVVVRDPIVREQKANDTRSAAQLISLPAAVCGSIGKVEDVDFYKFHAAAGKELTFHVWAQRLENRIHDLQEHADPIITLYDEAGIVLAMNDNYFSGDPLLHFRFPKDGQYVLEIRDARYSGDPYWEYCIEINDRPFVTNVLPSRILPGIPTELHLVGYNLPTNPVANVTLPSQIEDGLRWIPLLLSDHRETNPAPLIVSRLPDVHAAPGEHGSPGKAQTIHVPAGISGCLLKPGSIDYFSFRAKKGERFTFRVVARAHHSALDSYLRILDAKGAQLAENDDARDRFVHADSLIENWTAPADGQFFAEIRDLHARSGPAYVYFLEIIKSEPYFTLEIDTDKTILAPGVASPVFVRAQRHGGYNGEIELGVRDLPAGVTATCGRILPSGRDGCIILRAAENAKVEAGNIRIVGTGAGKPTNLSALAQPLEEIYMPGGGRFHYPVETHTVSVCLPLDLRAVKFSPPAVTLKPGESKKIEIQIERSPGFKQTVTLALVYQHLGAIFGDTLPAGVSVDQKASQTLLTSENSKGWITLHAAANAQPTDKQMVAVMAHVSINFVVKLTYCGEPLLVSVSK